MINVKLNSSPEIKVSTSIGSSSNVSVLNNNTVNVGIVNSSTTNVQVVKSGQTIVGKSAYQIAVENGFSGTQQQWLQSLKGSSGKSPYISQMTNTWWAYDDQQSSWYNTGVAKSGISKLSQLIIDDDAILILNCGTSTQVMG